MARYVLGVALDLTLEQARAWDFAYGWTDERNGNIIILATNGSEGPPVLVECQGIRTYRTLVTVHAVLLE